MEVERIFANNGFEVNTYMPPGAPGSMQADFDALLNCWQKGPENTAGCEWVIHQQEIVVVESSALTTPCIK